MEIHNVRTGEHSNTNTTYTDVQLKPWIDFMQERNVTAERIIQQLDIISEKNLEFNGLTEAQRLLPQRDYVGRGIESLILMPGQEYNESLAAKTMDLVASTFHPDESVAEADKPTSTWGRHFNNVMNRKTCFIEQEPGKEGYIGVSDATIVYLARTNPEKPLTLSEIPGARLVGIHGMYHYLPEPDVYHGLRLAVDPLLHGQGFGSKIMSHNLNLCLSLGAKVREIMTEEDPEKNKKVLDIYKSWGFKPNGRTVKFNGVQQIYLSAELKPGTTAWSMAMNFKDEGPGIKL